MLTFKPFTTLLNITLNKPTLCVKTAPYVDVEPSAVNRLCLSMRDVRDYYRVEDYHPVATAGTALHSKHYQVVHGCVCACFRVVACKSVCMHFCMSENFALIFFYVVFCNIFV